MVGIVMQSQSSTRFRELESDIEAIGTGGRIQFPNRFGKCSICVKFQL